jgi:hypothetical protein
MHRLSAIALWPKLAGVTHKYDRSAGQHKIPTKAVFTPLFHGGFAVWKAGGAFIYFALDGHSTSAG